MNEIQQVSPITTQSLITNNQKTTSTNTRNTLVTIVFLLFMYPVGLIFMWSWTDWPKGVKWLITSPVILMLVLAVFFLLMGFLVIPLYRTFYMHT